MKTCDYSRSFVTFVTKERSNNARIQVEARCTIVDNIDGSEEEYHLLASCKSEDTYGKGVLFYEPNYDFCAIFSDKEFILIRVGAPYKPNDTIGDNEGFFEEVRRDIVMADEEVLAGNVDIVKATLDNRLLNGRTTITDPAGRYRATIEFPIKTMNANDIRNIYQVDTGPILLPDFKSQERRMVERFDLAYIAYSKPDEAYFVIQEPISVCTTEEPKVNHYSRIVRMEAENEVVALL